MEHIEVKYRNNCKHTYENNISDVDVAASWEFKLKKESDNDTGLRQPQFGALTAIQSYWTIKDDVATIVMPTGTGKTETMIATIVAEKIKHTLIIVPSDLLRTQTVKKVCDFGVLKNIGVVGKESIKPITLLLKSLPKEGEKISDILENTNVVVSTMSLVSKLSSADCDELVHFTDLLIVDEAHHVAANSWSKFKSKFKEKKILQFTATPFRDDGKKVDGEIIYNFPLRKAQEQHYFQKINFYPIYEFNEEKGDLSIADKAVECLKADLKRGLKHILLVRTTSINRAHRLFEDIYSKYYSEYNPVLITSDVSVKDKRRRLEALKDMSSKIVVCVDMFGEGIDIPNLKIAAIHDKYKSLPVTLQFVGRFARTKEGLGDASIITNIVDDNLKESLKDLYSQDSDWNVLLADMSSKAVGREVSLQELEKGFKGNGIDGINIKQIQPKVSMQAFRIESTDINWEGWKNILDEDKCKYYLNEEKGIIVLIEPAESNIEWAHYREVTNLNWELHIVYINKKRKIAFVNTSVKSKALTLVQELVGGCDRIKGENIFRCLSGINRLMLGTVGLNSAIHGPIRYKMFAGVDIAQGLSEAQKNNSTKSNLFGVGYDGNKKVSIGCSYKGTIWSRWVESIDYWMDWCNEIINKVLDDSIDVNEILKGVLIPREITEIPSIQPYRIDWPLELDLCNDSLVYIGSDAISEPIYNIDIKLCKSKDDKRLVFKVCTEHFSEEFYYDVNESGYKCSHKAGKYLKMYYHKKEYILKDYFQGNPPTVKFVNQSTLQGNYYVTLREKTPLQFDENKISRWDWKTRGVNIRKESQGLSKDNDSIQYSIIEFLKDNKYDIIFDDDNSGEIADIVAIKVCEEEVMFEFYHCKYSHGNKPGARVNDLYEVCGQTEKSVEWKKDMTEVITRMIKRENARITSGKNSRFEVGDFSKLTEIKNRLKAFPAKLKIFIVQPGVDADKLTEDMNQILMATDTYLHETYGVELELICS